MTIFTAAVTDDGHFDRAKTLIRLLESYVPSTPEKVSAETFSGWNAAEQERFNEQKTARIAGGIVLITDEIKDLNLEIRRAERFAARDIGRTGVIVNGPPTVGKTTAAFNAMVAAFQRHADRYPNWKRDKHIPVVYVEVPPGSTAKGIMGRFLRFFGVSFIEKMTLEERTRLVTKHLQRARPSLIVIDEMQNLSRVNNGAFESAQAIKNLLNAVKSVPLYVGFNLDRLLSHDDLGRQFAARSTVVNLEPLKSRTTQGKKMWRALIRGFEAQFALFSHPAGTLIPHADYLWQRTNGSIAALSRLLTVAALELIDAPPEKQIITVQLLKTIKLDLITEQGDDNPTLDRERRAA
ncbi:TniB family NTP-binding protein [Microbacterium sp. NPDC090225]|uniref:TniB family NTP-binding protein n=1 Tax=Microbacterium sp. NPDC090225 TaxID=3364207 RepID=UPI00380738FC